MQSTFSPAAIVREANEDDLTAATAVICSAYIQFAPVLPPAFYHAFLTNAVDVRGRLPDSQLLVAELDGRIVGTMTLYPDASREGWGWPSHWTGIRTVAVIPEARGLGIGRRLTQECIDRSRTLGAAAVCLHTASFMDAAVSMYERFGFRRLRAFDQDVRTMFASEPNEPPITALAYWLDLESRSPVSSHPPGESIDSTALLASAQHMW